MRHYKNLLLLTLIGSITLLSGCASVVPKDQKPDIDPFEYTNRKLFTVNKKLDEYITEPAAKGYRNVTPDFFRTGVRNFFANIEDIPIAVNQLLQFEPKKSAVQLVRFGINSTVGIVGIVDVAAKLGLKREKTYFGQTLQKWGITYSPYVFLPLLGPSTVRDSAGQIVDSHLNPFFSVASEDARRSYRIMYGLSVRESLLDKKDLINTLSFDEYLFVRNAYLQSIGSELPVEHSGEFDEFDDEFGENDFDEIE